MRKKFTTTPKESRALLKGRNLWHFAEHICKSHHVAFDDMVGKVKVPRYQRARDALLFALREAGLSYREIAQTLGVTERLVRERFYGRAGVSKVTPTPGVALKKARL